MRHRTWALIVIAIALGFGGRALAEDAPEGAGAPPGAPATAVPPSPADLPAARPATVDELADLVAKVAPPERFKDHVPAFTAKEEEFEFQPPVEKPAGEKGKPTGRSLYLSTGAEKGKAPEKEGPQTVKATLWLVRDGPRVVAIYHPKASKLYVPASDPTKASEKPDLPPTYDDGGNTFDGKLGVRLTTFPACYGAAQTGEHKFAFTGGGRTITLTDTTRWPDRKKAEAVYVLTLRCDPVLGYVVECDVNFKADTPKDEMGKALDPELMNFLPDHVFMQKWPDARWRYEYTICTPAGDGKQAVADRYVGWVNDFGAADKVRGLLLRNGGFMLFAADPDGAGHALTATVAEGSQLKNDAGNLRYDQHYRATLPAKPDAEGLYGVKAKFRYAAVPPQVVRHVMDRMEMTDWRDNAAVPLPLGRMEEFADEAARIKDSLVYKELSVTDRECHSGTKSLMLVGGRRLRLDTVPPLEPGATYRLEVWLKVTGFQGEARLMAEPPKWLPKDTVWELLTSAPVRSGDGWKQVTLELTSGPCGSTPTLYMGVSRYGTAYLDDVAIRKIEKTEGGAPANAQAPAPTPPAGGSPAKAPATEGGTPGEGTQKPAPAKVAAGGARDDGTKSTAAGATAGNATARFLGSASQWSKCKIVLHDVQGLFGGRDICIDGLHDCIISLVSQGLQEKRFRMKLFPEETYVLRRLCIEGDLAALKIKERPGLPDEARPEITLTNAAGETCSVAKWAGDKVPEFDNVYEALMALERKTQNKKPEYEGKYEPAEKPEKK